MSQFLIIFHCITLKVSIRACEECRVLQWHRDKLKLILLSDAFLSAVFEHILGIDVVRKLTQVHQYLKNGLNKFTSLHLIIFLKNR